ncbi:MAG: N-formylglutamate amidohydrolase [Marinicella sp.]
MPLFELIQAKSPLVISVPHDGALIPDDILDTMNQKIIGSSDRDLLIDEVFEFKDLPYSKIKANYSRHVIDLNRPATGESLYKDQPETELCPTSTFDFKAVYKSGNEPDNNEISRRVKMYWQPYHDQLAQLIQAAKDQFGFCLLVDAHSIDDEVPRFFAGRLPEINLGTFGGNSCAVQFEQLLIQLLNEQSDFTHVCNARFKGGYITRHYGQPHHHVHAIQLEHAKSAYLNNELLISVKGNKLREFWQHTLKSLLSVHNS